MTDSQPPASQPNPDDTPASGGARVFEPDFLTELFHNPLDAGYSDAAKRKRAKGEGPPAVRRAGFALRMIVLVATGALLSVAYQQTIAAQPERSKVRAGLIADVQERQRDTGKLQRQADSLRSQVGKLRDSVLAGAGASALGDLETATGVAAVTGGGAVVTLSDGPAPTDPVTGKPDTDPGHFLGRVLDTDLQLIVNELWRDGAEAIAINGQRLTATSTIRTAGSAILVDFAPLAQPYQVVAIGPSTLGNHFNSTATAAEYRRLRDTYGMHFSVAQRGGLRAPAAADPQLRYAKPLSSGTASPAPSPPPSKTNDDMSISHPSPSSSGGS